MDTFKCALCGGTFSKTRSDDAALVESQMFFGTVAKEDLEIICDDCFQKIHPAKYPELVRDAVHKYRSKEN